MLPAAGEKWAFFFLSHAIGGIHVQICLSHFSRDGSMGFQKTTNGLRCNSPGMDIECPKYLVGSKAFTNSSRTPFVSKTTET